MAYNKTSDWFKWKANQLISNYQTRHKKIDKAYSFITKRADYAEILKTKLTQCGYCGIKLNKTNFSADHDIPLTLGGDTSDDNLVYCCQQCNGAKGEMTGAQFKELISITKNWDDKGKYLFKRLRAAALVFKRRGRR
jgi:5-methylcytosine-specific restriction endonuclease McrA